MSRFWPKSLHRGVWTLGVAALAAAVAFPTTARAQWPMAQQPQSTPQNASQAATQPRLTPEQLDNLVAPIALYPDPLLSQVLVASTYPLEVVEAQQWLKQNSSLGGQQLMAAAQQQNWDASVQALVAFPDVLDTLTQDVQWTTALGNAFLAQQQDVMAAVQRMRAQAQANGRLASNAEQTVNTANQDGQSAIEIQPANPDVVYVPQYDPMYIWGPPAWGYYPALYYPAYGYGFWPGINIGLCFGGWGWGGWGWGGWGWSPGWFGGNVFVNYGFFNHFGFRSGFGGHFGGGQFGRGVWAHNPEHRLGVAYPNRQLTSRYGAASTAARANSLSGFRSAGSGMRNSFGQSSGGANRSGFAGGAGRSAMPGAQGFRGGTQGMGRSYQSPAYGRSPGMSGNSYRSFSGSSPAFRGGSAPAFRGSAPSYGGGGFRGYSGGGARSFSGGGGGGGFRGFSGGGGHSFGGGGGGGHFGGGGGGHFGGGGHGGGHR